MFVIALLLQIAAAEPSVVESSTASDWGRVRAAAKQLENGGAVSLPVLIGLLDRDKVVPLTNTADLIYPGASAFYGHGEMVDHDVDRLSIRAGWVLEAVTFEDFGFSE